MTVEAPTRPAPANTRTPGLRMDDTAPSNLPRMYSVEHVHKTMLGNPSLRTIQRWRVKLGLPHPTVIGDGPNSLKCYLADDIDAWFLKRLKKGKK